MSDDELKSIPLGQLIEMRRNGKEIKGSRPSNSSIKIKKSKQKKDKNAPQEISSKIHVRKHKAIDVSNTIRDPRFDGLSGKFNYDLYRKSYKWMEEKQDDEVKEMKQQMYSTEDVDEKRTIQSKMTRVMQQKVDRERKDRALERKREFMKAEREAVSKGKKPFFLKKSVIKEAELKDRFESLNKRGRVNKYMEKKRRRNMHRDVANMPEVRQRD